MLLQNNINIHANKNKLYNKYFNLKKELTAIKNNPFIIFADNILYNNESNIINISGNVKILQDCRVIFADRISYNQKNSEIIANGKIIIQNSNADLLFTDYIKTDSNNNQYIKNIKILTHNMERFVASEMKTDSISKIEYLKKVHYTPCERCKDSLHDTPTWYINAESIEIDKKNNSISYNDANLYLLNTPILYIPYLTHPIKKSSGFLIPGVSFITETGFTVNMPYLILIDDSSDILIKPYFMSKAGLMLYTKYRKRFNYAIWKIEIAINNSKKDTLKHIYDKAIKLPSLRGYFKSKLIYNINDNWRLLSKEYFVTDQTFLVSRPFFNIKRDIALESKTSLEGFYIKPFSAHLIDITKLKYDYLLYPDNINNNIQTIYSNNHSIIPIFTYKYISPNYNLGYVIINFDSVYLHKKYKLFIQRNTFDIAYQYDHINSNGQFITTFIKSIQNIYFNSNIRNNVKHSSLYQIGFSINQPLLFMDSIISIIDPKIQFIISPKTKSYIINEDCIEMNFSDIQLFETNRVSGRDIIDSGSRINYGIEIEKYYNNYNISAFIGQSYSFSQPHFELQKVGILKGFSNIVGRFGISNANKTYYLYYRFRLLNNKFSLPMQEVMYKIGSDKLNLTGNYFYINNKLQEKKLFSTNALFSNSYNRTYINQLHISCNTKFHKHWIAGIGITCNLNKKYVEKIIIDKRINVCYQDDCFITSIAISKSSIKYRELKPGYAITFSIIFKNLGGLKQDINKLYNFLS